MDWPMQCNGCNNLLSTTNKVAYCAECWQQQISNMFEDLTTKINWKVEVHGHWKGKDDVMCRCCHKPNELIHAFELTGAL